MTGRIVDFRLRIVDFRLRSVDFRLRSVGRSDWSPNFREERFAVYDREQRRLVGFVSIHQRRGRGARWTATLRGEMYHVTRTSGRDAAVQTLLRVARTGVAL